MAKARTAARQSSDAIAILKADHDKVKKLFKEFERLHEKEADDEAEQIAQQICKELTIHAQVEEEVFYPRVREAIDDEDLLNEAEVEHASAKDLISQIESSSAADGKYGALVMVLGEYVNHHISEEQNELFPKAKKSKLDMDALGERIMARKQELKAEMGLEEETDEMPEQKAPRGKPRSARNGQTARR